MDFAKDYPRHPARGRPDIPRKPESRIRYCYRLQAWVVEGHIPDCGHPARMRPGCCYAGDHAGDPHPIDCPDCH